MIEVVLAILLSPISHLQRHTHILIPASTEPARFIEHLLVV